MQLIGQTVEHPVFGQGIVTEKSAGMLTVSFREGEKKFLYPDAFPEFLVLENTKLQEELLGAMKAREEVQEQKKQEELDRWEHEIALRQMKITPRSQAVFHVRPEETEQVFQRWEVSTGTYLSGLSKGEPRVPDKIKPNSMCLLTTRPGGCPESQRRIIGVFMADDHFCGSECRDGMVPAHGQYRLKLENPPLFWPYLMEEKSSQRWGNTSFKYILNTVGETILRDLRNRAVGTEQEKETEDFYRYYCQINQLPAIPAGKIQK